MLLNSAGISQASVARKSRIAAPVLNRFLTGQRLPSILMIKRINAAFGSVFASEEIEHYLNAIAAEGGLPTDPAARVRGAFAAVEWIINMAPSTTDKVVDVLNAGDGSQLALLAALNVIWRRYMIRDIAGTPRAGIFDELIGLFKKFNVDLEPDFGDLAVIRAKDQFATLVKRLLADIRLNHPTRKRVALDLPTRNRVAKSVIVEQSKVLETSQISVLEIGRLMSRAAVLAALGNYSTLVERHIGSKDATVLISELKRLLEASIERQFR